MQDIFNQSSHKPTLAAPLVIGIILISMGSLFLLDQFLKTGWLTLAIVPLLGMGLSIGGILYRKSGLAIAGALLLGLGIGGGVMLNSFTRWDWPQRIGLALLSFALGWVLVSSITIWSNKIFSWWALIPAVVIGSTGACFLFTSLRFLDFVLYIVTAMGILFLALGVYTRLLGLIIPGALLFGIGPGVYVGWGIPDDPTSILARTGSMLVVFALGWGLITLFSKMVIAKFIWWPLIPAGILAVTGWGLYIGGEPGGALHFIGNTGSIGLIIFGVYLLLMRRGFHK